MGNISTFGLGFFTAATVDGNSVKPASWFLGTSVSLEEKPAVQSKNCYTAHILISTNKSNSNSPIGLKVSSVFILLLVKY